MFRSINYCPRYHFYEEHLACICSFILSLKNNVLLIQFFFYWNAQAIFLPRRIRGRTVAMWSVLTCGFVNKKSDVKYLVQFISSFAVFDWWINFFPCRFAVLIKHFLPFTTALLRLRRVLQNVSSFNSFHVWILAVITSFHFHRVHDVNKNVQSVYFVSFISSWWSKSSPPHIIHSLVCAKWCDVLYCILSLISPFIPVLFIFFVIFGRCKTQSPVVVFTFIVFFRWLMIIVLL